MEIKFEDRDEYLRKPIAENIIKLLCSDAKVSPFVIDGGWGTGKTEFCSKLINLVRDQDPVPFKAVYVDAFKADHADQPLMTLLAAVLTVVPEKEAASLVKKALPALRFGLKTGGKAIIGWALKQDPVNLSEDFEKVIGQAGDAAIDHAVENMLKDHQHAEKSIQALKGVLAQAAEDIPIVLFVDELDRCRPDFAVSMLEVIKHVFDVERVKIVLITNTEQLKAVINHCYGGGVDAQRYLDKFVGFSFSLPIYLNYQRHGDMALVASKHLSGLLEQSVNLRNKISGNNHLDGFVKALVRARNMSLREVETFVKYLDVYQVLSAGEGLAGNLIAGYAVLRVYAVYCYAFFPDLARRFVIGMYEPSHVLATINRKGSDLAINDLYRGDEYLMAVIYMLIGRQWRDASGSFVISDDQVTMLDSFLESLFYGTYHPPKTSKEFVNILNEVYGVLSMSSK